MTDIASDAMRLFCERAERLIEERKGLNEDLRDVFLEARGQGFDIPTMKWAIKERALEAAKRREMNALRELYAIQLGLDL